MPNDHVRVLVEFLKRGSPDLSRRWLAALMLVPEKEREDVVRAIEARMVEVYDTPHRSPAPAAEPRELIVRLPPRQRDGYVEEITKTYEVAPPAQAPAKQNGKRRAHRA